MRQFNRQAVFRPLLVAIVLALGAGPVRGDEGGGFDPLLSLCLASLPPVQPGGIWSAWSLAPEIVLPLVAALLLYGYGFWNWSRSAAGRRPSAWRAASFAAGWLLLAVAVVSPLCRMAATLASAHMVQHVLLVAVVPLLLALGGSAATLSWALPARWRGLALHRTRPRAASGGSLAIAAVYGAAIWLWHVPAVYQAALLDEAVHLLMYATLLGAGFLFWHDVVGAAGDRIKGAALASVGATLLHTGLLGALLTFAPRPWYPVFAGRTEIWGLTPLADQQLAGIIMWVPMGAIYLAASLGLLAAWLAALERRGTSRG